MATTAFRGTPVRTAGELPEVGSPVPSFSLTGTDLADFAKEDLVGRRVVLNIFPSIDTGVCATSVRTFNELAADLRDTVVVCASKDLPFAHQRFCGAEGIENVSAASAMRAMVTPSVGRAPIVLRRRFDVALSCGHDSP